jgi:hypothetical protein
VITWSSSATGATYKWLLDAPAGTFATPIAALPSDASGTDTKLTLTSGAIDNLLAAQSIADGDSALLKWTVRAFRGTDSLQATQTFNLTLVRKKNVGLNETNLNTLVNVYPNPTSSNTTLSIHLETAEKVEVSIADVQGKVIINKFKKEVTSGPQEIELPTASLQDGIYFVNIHVGEKSAQVKLVVIH